MPGTEEQPWSGTAPCGDRRKRHNTSRLTVWDFGFVGKARNCTVAKVRVAQANATVALVPLGSAMNWLNAIIVAVALKDEVPHLQLYCWLVAMSVVVIARLVSTRWFSWGERLFPLIAGAIATALLWSIPLAFWAPLMSQGDRILVPIVLAGIMSGGSVLLANVPPAAMSYIAILTAGTTYLSASFAEPVLTPLVIGFGLALACASLRHASQYAAQMSMRIDLNEKIQLLGLLREFGSSGSDWLWEMDADQRLTYVSNSFAEAIGIPVKEVVGKDVRDLLDPNGDVAAGSSGMRALFDHFAKETAFIDLAVPYHGRWCAISGKPLFHDGNCIGWRGVGSDITDVRLKGSDATRAARRDPMTGLSNRLLLREELEQALLPGATGGCALMLIDLDRFKLVNDTLGHSVGDELLKMAATRLESCVGDMALVGRVGGDEFAVVWRSDIDRFTLAELARLVIARLSQVFLINDVEVRIGATVGIAIAPSDGRTQEELTSSADLALYRAKEIQRGSFHFFESWMGEVARENRQLESELRLALETRALSIAYQPIVRTSDGQLTGYEALLRWNHPERGEIPPGKFVPIIEESGLITRVGNWVIEQACAEAATWEVPVPVAVNVSAAQLTGSWLAWTVAEALSRSGLPPERLEIEVTEGIFLGDDAMALGALSDLHALGVRLVLDDFGKGYSAFGYLTRARFSKVKIDCEFVHGAAADEREHLAIVEAILALSRRLGIEATAEGIESEQQEQMMRRLGCEEMQGFRFGRPVPAETIARIRTEQLRRYG